MTIYLESRGIGVQLWYDLRMLPQYYELNQNDSLKHCNNVN